MFARNALFLAALLALAGPALADDPCLIWAELQKADHWDAASLEARADADWGCYTQTLRHQVTTIATLRPGASAASVLDALGEPNRRRGHRYAGTYTEAWTYKASGARLVFIFNKDNPEGALEQWYR